MHILKTEKSILKIKTYQNEYIYIDTNNYSSNNSSSCKDGTHSCVEVKDKGLILHISTNSQNMYINNDLNNHGISIILIKIPYQNIKYIGGIIDNDNISKMYRHQYPKRVYNRLSVNKQRSIYKFLRM
jgi:hypothetical protein